MRIAFVYDALYPFVHGGAERRYHELGVRLRDRHDVHFVSWQWWDGPARVTRDGMTYHGVGRPPAFYGEDGKRTVREAMSFAARILPILARNRWDVVDCSATPYLPLYTCWLGTRLSGSRMVATWHEYWGEHWREYLPDRPVVARLAQRIESASRHLGSELVAVSDFTAGRLRPMNGVIHVVENGVSSFDAGTVSEARTGADVIFIGRLIDEKRVDVLLQAVAGLSERIPAMTCDIVGDGPELDRLRRQAGELGVGHRVSFHGRLSQTDALIRLQSARILVLPSLREGFGMVVLEAQAAGTVPVVARSELSAAGALVKSGTDGLTVEGSAEGIANGIARLLESRDAWARMSVAARAAARRRDWEVSARRMEEIYSTDARRVAPVSAGGRA
jgi:L-malate glycosyltransferase